MPKGQSAAARRERFLGLCCPIHGSPMGSSAPQLADPPWVYLIRCWRDGCDITVGVWVYHGEPSRLEVLTGPGDAVGLSVTTMTPWDEPEEPFFATRQIPVADGKRWAVRGAS